MIMKMVIIVKIEQIRKEEENPSQFPFLEMMKKMNMVDDHNRDDEKERRRDLSQRLTIRLLTLVVMVMKKMNMMVKMVIIATKEIKEEET